MKYHSPACPASVGRSRASQRLEVQQLEPRNAPGNALPLLGALWGLSPPWWGEVGLLSELGIVDAPRENNAQQSPSPAPTRVPWSSASPGDGGVVGQPFQAHPSLPVSLER